MKLVNCDKKYEMNPRNPVIEIKSIVIGMNGKTIIFTTIPIIEI